MASYFAWANAPRDDYALRSETWDNYCDHRDNVPKGTSRKIRIYGDAFLALAVMGLHDE